MCLDRPTEECIYELVREGRLEIDDEGRVWRIAVSVPGPGKTRRIVASQRRRAERLASNGYLTIVQSRHGHYVETTAARVIWYHFYGTIPPGLTVNHRNGVKTENRPANLELATSREQSIHRDHIIRTGATSKLTEVQVVEIRRRLAAGESARAIAKAFNAGMTTVGHIQHGRTWKHLL
jgi:HNH endonuclease